MYNARAEEKVDVTVTMTVPVTRENLANIVDVALYAGIDYWCERVEVVGGVLPEGCEFMSQAPAYGGALRILVPDNPKDEDDEWYILDEAALVRGLSLAAGKPNIPTYDAKDDDWVGDVDATAADVIVQYGIFGEVVFG